MILILLWIQFASAGLILQPTPPVTQNSTVQQKQAATLLAIQQNITQGFQTNLSIAQSSFGYIWNNPYGLDAHQAMAALGTNACTAHTLLISLCNLLNSAQAGACASAGLVDPCTVTCQGNGSALVSCSGGH